MTPELVLHGLFRHLQCQGFCLGIHDYLDALEALRAGFGLNDRARLLWLCQTLWARTEEESRRIALLFGQFPKPTDTEVEAFTGERVAPEPTDIQTSRAGATSVPIRDTAPLPQVTIEFTPAGRAGLALPRPHITRGRSEPFVLTPRPPIQLRELVIIWRRFRAAMRTGPKTELDLEATMEQQCRTGRLTSPTLVAARRNLARLTLLVDVSPSMQPWQSFIPLLRESLRHGQLREVAIYFFDNLPEGVVYRTEALTGPEPIEAALERHAGSPLLILGDGGAARGNRNPDRTRATRDFLRCISASWRPVAWINPMPRHRWRRTSFDVVVRTPGVAAFTLTEGELIQAIDVLRGKREA
jgi:hypothetical protein